MKRVLVTGAAGVIGIKTIKYLLSEGKYEITALDLRNKSNYKKLKKYRRRINIIYGDINDKVLIEALVKDQDYIIHLASVLPPIADIKKGLSDNIEYLGTENIIKAINFYNPECFLVYASSSTIYGKKEVASIKTKANLTENDYYSNTKLKTEELIEKRITEGSVLASDAFFPFSDCVEEAHKAGIKAIIQPGGSIKDQDSINKCNEYGIAMVFTKMRHFKH